MNPFIIDETKLYAYIVRGDFKTATWQTFLVLSDKELPKGVIYQVAMREFDLNLVSNRAHPESTAQYDTGMLVEEDPIRSYTEINAIISREIFGGVTRVNFSSSDGIEIIDTALDSKSIGEFLDAMRPISFTPEEINRKLEKVDVLSTELMAALNELPTVYSHPIRVSLLSRLI